MDNIILKNVKLVSFNNSVMSSLKKQYDFTTSTVNCIDLNVESNIYSYDLDVHYFSEPVSIQGETVCCLIKATKYYDEDEYRYLMDIKSDNTGFFYGKIIGVGPIKDTEDYSKDIMYMPVLKLD